jgi:hypothetical protein
MKGIISVLLGLCFPGLGHYYIGQKPKAYVFGFCILLSFFIGLSLDFDYYYRYDDIKRQSIILKSADESKSQELQMQRVNPEFDSKIRFFTDLASPFPERAILSGHTRPGLAIEILNETNGEKIQTQADYRGFFTLPALLLAKGENRLTYGAANDYFTKESGQEIHISDYDAKARYKPGTLEKLWHFIYEVIFPVLSTPALHFSGGAIQGIIINWWEKSPIVKNEKSIPAPLRDVGFYFMVLACMLNLIVLFDVYDFCHNKERIDDIP